MFVVRVYPKLDFGCQWFPLLDFGCHGLSLVRFLDLSFPWFDFGFQANSKYV